MDYKDPNVLMAMSMNWVLNAYNFFKEQAGDEGTAMQLTDIWWANMIDALMAGANNMKKNDDEED